VQRWHIGAVRCTVALPPAELNREDFLFITPPQRSYPEFIEKADNL